MSVYFAGILKSIRKSKNLSQEELSAILRRTPSQIGLYEQGRNNPSYEVMESMIHKLGVRADVFFPVKSSGNMYDEILCRIIATMTDAQKKLLTEFITSMTGMSIDDFVAKDAEEDDEA